MVLKQTHFPKGNGPNWIMIVIGSFVIITAGVIAGKMMGRIKTKDNEEPPIPEDIELDDEKEKNDELPD